MRGFVLAELPERLSDLLVQAFQFAAACISERLSRARDTRECSLLILFEQFIPCPAMHDCYSREQQSYHPAKTPVNSGFSANNFPVMKS